MGEVNVIPVRRRADQLYEGVETPDLQGRGRRPPTGFIVVRPEFLRLIQRHGDAENVIEGELYNSYSLGSRMQYRVRAGDKVMILEQSRAAGAGPRSISKVLVGWDSRDALFVEA